MGLGPSRVCRPKISVCDDSYPNAITGERFPKKFASHDLRRTVATRLAEVLGDEGDTLIKCVLGHSDGGVTAIYNRICQALPYGSERNSSSGPVRARGRVASFDRNVLGLDRLQSAGLLGSGRNRFRTGTGITLCQISMPNHLAYQLIFSAALSKSGTGASP